MFPANARCTCSMTENQSLSSASRRGTSSAARSRCPLSPPLRVFVATLLIAMIMDFEGQAVVLPAGRTRTRSHSGSPTATASQSASPSFDVSDTGASFSPTLSSSMSLSPGATPSASLSMSHSFTRSASLSDSASSSLSRLFNCTNFGDLFSCTYNATNTLCGWDVSSSTCSTCHPSTPAAQCTGGCRISTTTGLCVTKGTPCSTYRLASQCMSHSYAGEPCMWLRTGIEYSCTSCSVFDGSLAPCPKFGCWQPDQTVSCWSYAVVCPTQNDYGECEGLSNCVWNATAATCSWCGLFTDAVSCVTSFYPQQCSWDSSASQCVRLVTVTAENGPVDEPTLPATEPRELSKGEIAAIVICTCVGGVAVIVSIVVVARRYCFSYQPRLLSGGISGGVSRLQGRRSVLGKHMMPPTVSPPQLVSTTALRIPSVHGSDDKKDATSMSVDLDGVVMSSSWWSCCWGGGHSSEEGVGARSAYKDDSFTLPASRRSQLADGAASRRHGDGPSSADHHSRHSADNDRHGAPLSHQQLVASSVMEVISDTTSARCESHLGNTGRGLAGLTPSEALHDTMSALPLPLDAMTEKERAHVTKIVRLIRKKKYRQTKLLGRGANGSVYHAVLDDGTILAVKEVLFTPLSQEELEGAMSEVALVSSIRHPNIVEYYTSVFEPSDMRFSIFMELLSNGSLGDLVRSSPQPIADDLARTYTRQITTALAFIHRLGIAHRDLKCDNLLLSQDGNLKLCDFGAAKNIGTQHSVGAQTMIGTPFFMAPEILGSAAAEAAANSGAAPLAGSGGSGGTTGSYPKGQGTPPPSASSSDQEKKKVATDHAATTIVSTEDSSGESEESRYGKRCDVWSLGITVLEMLNCGVAPWPVQSVGATMLHIASPNGVPIYPTHLTPLARSFVESCCVRDPRKRLTSAELLNHPWLAENGDDNDDEDAAHLRVGEALSVESSDIRVTIT